MHCPRPFREERIEILHALIARHPLATLITAGRGGLLANPIPFSLHADADGGRGVLRAHLARANPQLGALRDGTEALVVFHGPQGYVTPAWYPSKAEHGRVVPTWNYATVQVRGRPRVIDDPAWLRAQVGELTRRHEHGRASPWAVSDAPDDFVAAQLKGIAGLEIPIASIDGKWKLGQNRPPADRRGVIDGLRAERRCPALAALMERG